MKYYCQCGEQLKSQRVKSGDFKTGTQKWVSHKVLIVKTYRRYVCPNGCELKIIKQN